MSIFIWGISFLSQLLKRFAGEKIYAIASYNAGGGRVGKWKRQKHLSLIHFALFIPYDQTEKYVQKVLKSYITYKSLYPSL